MGSWGNAPCGVWGGAPNRVLGAVAPNAPFISVTVPFPRFNPDSPLSPKAVYGGESADFAQLKRLFESSKQVFPSVVIFSRVIL